MDQSTRTTVRTDTDRTKPVHLTSLEIYIYIYQNDIFNLMKDQIRNITNFSFKKDYNPRLTTIRFVLYPYQQNKRNFLCKIIWNINPTYIYQISSS